MSIMVFLVHIAVQFILITFCNGLLSTSVPPLLDVPTYSLSTTDEAGRTGMNILTYATPVSMKPKRIWSIALYKGTVAHENFSRTGQGVLQLLAPEHSKLVEILGRFSGRDIQKKEECRKLGFPWIESNRFKCEILPGCSYYLKIKISDHGMIDCGSHDVALCFVEDMLIQVDAEEGIMPRYLTTGKLRESGIITAQGKVDKKS